MKFNTYFVGGGSEEGVQNFGRKMSRKYHLRAVGVNDKLLSKLIFKNMV
jgi:hypothetical protein